MKIYFCIFVGIAIAALLSAFKLFCLRLEKEIAQSRKDREHFEARLKSLKNALIKAKPNYDN
jgi:hypothetical protein